MAMYVFRELKPKVFLFEYCLQEIGNYIGFLEEFNGAPTTPSDVRDNIAGIKEGMIKSWQPKNFGWEKVFSDSDKEKNTNPRLMFLTNNLKATFHHCFSQYKLFNNIEEDVNLDPNFLMRKYKEGEAVKHEPVGKYTARLYVNNSFAGGDIIVPGVPTFFADAGSIIIAPSELDISAEPAQKSCRYIGYGYWV